MSGEGFDFSSFARENWNPRKSSKQKNAAKRSLEKIGAAAQKRLCSELGARYSVLQELEYFDRISYFAVDPMHNFYLGTAKHMMMSVCLNEKIEFLNDEDFQFLEIFSYTRKDFIKFLRIHSRSMEKLDISVFIVFAQRNPPEDHLQRWRFFLLACKTLGMGDLTDNDI